jgi:hypothetical protein
MFCFTAELQQSPLLLTLIHSFNKMERAKEEIDVLKKERHKMLVYWSRLFAG